MFPIMTKKELKQVLDTINQKDSLGLVPTMGALHLGHASLIEKAVSENDYVVVSIFVNPTQFNNADDLIKYPKTINEDLTLIKDISTKIIVFTPSIKEIYNENIISKSYDFNGLDKVMEGEFRDNHFNGVGTIVEELFKLIKPTRAYFGEKDFQQLRIIQKLTQIQHIPVQIIGCPIVRESNGLAMSSRNERLDKTLRLKAGFIYKTLQTAKEIFGMKSALETKEWVVNTFQNQMELELEYFEITDVETLTPTKTILANTKYRAFIAVYANDVRLIDNIALN
ncbi:pantoate--beta-alanine ligase [Maribacter sp. CXY002]|uniref:pantoate--beta-alanine ligase n=1 Tax=Maribacter luteocoastalis TaxID=3407671 RepID=UPI003B66CDB0